MLKRRVAASVIVKDGIVVQSFRFNRYLPIGRPDIALQFLSEWGIDEIILLDISATKNGRRPDFKTVRNASAKSYAPLTVGGGISSIDDIRELMNCGADKIALNQAALHNPKLITEAASIFGNQCVVVSIDADVHNGQYRVYDYRERTWLNSDPAEAAARACEAGAGEILINAVHRDGSYLGYDIDLIQAVCDAVNVPVICCGGAKNADDFITVFLKTQADAACAGNFFQFTEHSVNTTKSMINKAVPLRVDTYANYSENQFDDGCRLVKKGDDALENMLYFHIEPEVI